MDIEKKITIKIVIVFFIVMALITPILLYTGFKAYTVYKEEYAVPVTNIKPGEEVTYDIDTVLEQERLSDEGDYSYDVDNTSQNFSDEHTLGE